MTPTDTELLDWMDKQTGRYTRTASPGRVIWRWSSCGRGWRLHETSRPEAVVTVREAIRVAMAEEADAKSAQD